MCVFFVSAVQTHAGALVQVHVRVAEETLGHALHVSRHLIGQLGGRHVQVVGDLGAELHLRDVEAVSLTLSVGHAVEEEPVVPFWSEPDEGDVVTGLDAEDGEQLQFVSAHRGGGAALVQVTGGDDQGGGLVRAPLRVGVHLL